MKLDLKKFKKVAEDQHRTTLVSKEGHTITVAHAPLHPATRGQLAALPMADGGVATKSVPEAPKKNAKDMQTGGTSAGTTLSEGWANAKKELGFKDGGEVAIKKENTDDAAFSAMSKQAGPTGASGYNPNGPESADPRQYPVRDPKDMAPPRKPEPTSEHAKSMKGLESGGTRSGKMDERMAEGGGVGPIVTDSPEAIQEAAMSNPSNPVEVPQTEAPGFLDQAKHALLPGLAQYDNQPQAGFDATPQDGRVANTPDLSVANPHAPNPANRMMANPQASQDAPAAAAPLDPYGMNAMSQNTEKGLGELHQGMKLEQAAIEDQAAKQAQAIEVAQQKQAQTQMDYQAHYNQLDQERQALQKDIQDNNIDPNHFVNTMDGASKISTAIGLIASGLGGAMSHQENLASKFLSQQINNDIEAQKANLGKKESLLSANMRQFGNLRDATDMTRLMQADILSNQLKMEAAKAAGPLAQARLMQAAGDIDIKYAPLQAQIAMRKTLLGGMQTGKITPEQVLRSGIVPKEDHEAFRKEANEAQNAVALRDNTLSAFDKLSKIDTVLGKLNPQTRMQVAALKGATLDKLTKDTSGRVTPETVALIGSMFDTALANPKTLGVMKHQINDLLSQGMHYTTLKAYNQDPSTWGLYDQNGNARIQVKPRKR